MCSDLSIVFCVFCHMILVGKMMHSVKLKLHGLSLNSTLKWDRLHIIRTICDFLFMSYVKTDRLMDRRADGQRLMRFLLWGRGMNNSQL